MNKDIASFEVEDIAPSRKETRNPKPETTSKPLTEKLKPVDLTTDDSTSTFSKQPSVGRAHDNRNVVDMSTVNDDPSDDIVLRNRLASLLKYQNMLSFPSLSDHRLLATSRPLLFSGCTNFIRERWSQWIVHQRTGLPNWSDRVNLVIDGIDPDTGAGLNEACHYLLPLTSGIHVSSVIPMNLAAMQKFQRDIWLNDENINWFMGVFNNLFPDCFCFPSSLYTDLMQKGRDTRFRISPLAGVYDYGKVKSTTAGYANPIMRRKKLLFPLNWDNTHWTLLCVDMEKLFIYHLDGFHDRGNNNTSLRRNILAYIQDDFLDKLNEVFITSNFESIQEGSPGFTVPNQYDGNSCGIRVILCALMFLRGDTFAPDSFEDVDMNDMRLLLASMVVKGSVVPDQENGTSSTLPDGFPPFLYQDSPPSRPND